MIFTKRNKGLGIIEILIIILIIALLFVLFFIPYMTLREKSTAEYKKMTGVVQEKYMRDGLLSDRYFVKINGVTNSIEWKYYRKINVGDSVSYQCQESTELTENIKNAKVIK